MTLTIGLCAWVHFSGEFRIGNDEPTIPHHQIEGLGVDNQLIVPK